MFLWRKVEAYFYASLRVTIPRKIHFFNTENGMTWHHVKPRIFTRPFVLQSRVKFIFLTRRMAYVAAHKCAYFLVIFGYHIRVFWVPQYSKDRGLHKNTKKSQKKFLHEIPCKIYIFYNKNIPCKKTQKSHKKNHKKIKKL